MTVEEMWGKYCALSGTSKDTTYQSWHFCNSEKDANELAELTKQGIKRATSSLLKSYELENQLIPEVGVLNIITNWQREPVCVIENERVEILRFKDITEEHAQIEGEGDKSLKYWREGHIKFFEEETKEMGIDFHEELEVVFETFKVVYSTE